MLFRKPTKPKITFVLASYLEARSKWRGTGLSRADQQKFEVCLELSDFTTMDHFCWSDPVLYSALTQQLPCPLAAGNDKRPPVSYVYQHKKNLN